VIFIMETSAQPQLSIWKNRTFMRMFSAYSLSMTGQYFDMIAMAILFAYVWQADPVIIAMVPVAYAIPHVIFGQFAGILADRWKKINVMIMADIVVVVLTVILIFAPNPWWALPILMMRATATVFHFPAQQALVRQVVDEENLLKAVTLNGTVNQLSKVIGPFLGASIAAATSPQICLMINAIAFLLSALILFTIRKIKEEQVIEGRDPQENTFMQSWSKGWQIVLKSRVLMASFIFTLIGFIAIQLVDAQFAVLLRKIAPERPELVGWVMSSFGMGALCVVILLNRLKEIKSYGWVLGGSILLIGVGFTWIGMLKPGMSSLWYFVAGFIGGTGVGLFSVGFSYLLQKETPKDAIGRVSGIYNSMAGVILIIAPLIGGILVGNLGPIIVFQVIGVVIGTIGIIGIVFQRVFWGVSSKSEKEAERVIPQ
jgi:DHA3 family macrolide efflux protein-like MFS transporter